jgi:putative restriction endonuclease
MALREWIRDELVLAMNLYCRLPFGKFHSRNPEVIRLADAIGRTPSSVAMKLSNLASLDPAHQLRGVKGLSGASKADREIWAEFHADWERLAVESQMLSDEMKDERGEGKTDEEEKTAWREPRAPREVEVSEDVVYLGETELARSVRVRLAQRFFRRAVLAGSVQSSPRRIVSGL